MDELDNIVSKILKDFHGENAIIEEELSYYYPNWISSEEILIIKENIKKRGIKIVKYKVDDYKDTPAFTSYINQISSYPRMTKDECIKLGKLIKNWGDCVGKHSDNLDEEKELRRKELAVEQAKNELITRHLRLVIPVAARYRSYKQSIEDLVQIGNLGLIRAADTYDCDKNTAFSTYATIWIREQIVRFLQTDNTLSSGWRITKLITEISDFTEDYKEKYGTYPSNKTIMNELNISELRFYDAMAVKNGTENVLNLDSTITHQDESYTVAYTLADSLEDISQPTSDDIIDQLYRRAEIEDFLYNNLDEESAEVIMYRYGLGYTQAQHTAIEAQEHFGIPKERIRVIEKKAMTILKNEATKNPDLQLYIRTT